jgi:PHD/YefM family antitoxin component YafN of YafNO toxin-antitoxin module
MYVFMEDNSMIAKQIEIRNNIKSFFDKAYEGEVIIVPRKSGKNIVIISEKEYMKLSKGTLPAYYSQIKSVAAKAGESVSETSAKAKNLKKLEEISALNDNWNGNGAPKIPDIIIKKTRALLKALTIQPEIFPTALETIQLEFDNSLHDHMEIEIGTTDKAEVFVAPYDGKEYTETIRATAASINERVIAFYG